MAQVDPTRLPADPDEATPPATDLSGPEVTESEEEPSLWKKRYADSTREAQRLKTELDAAKAKLTQTEQQAQYALLAQQVQRQAQVPQVPQAPSATGYVTPEEVADFNQAVLEGNTQRTTEVFNKAFGRFRDQLATSATVYQQAQAEVAGVLSELAQAPELQQPAMQQQLALRALQIQNEKPWLCKPVPGAQINPWALREAVVEYRVKAGTATQAAAQTARATADVGIEAGRRTGPAQPGEATSTVFSEVKHLSEGEREYIKLQQARDAKYTTKRYWEGLPKEIREARLRLNRPVTRKELIQA